MLPILLPKMPILKSGLPKTAKSAMKSAKQCRFSSW